MQQLPRLTHRFRLQLESIRGLSALVVLFSHCYQAFIAPISLSAYPLVRLLGQAAVMVFFILSGYLIGISIQNNRQRFAGFNSLHFAKQRAQRILPPFLFALLLMGILYLLAPWYFASGSHAIVPLQGMMLRNEYAVAIPDLMATILFLNEFIRPTVSANAPLWSLSYECWFYVLIACFCAAPRPIPMLIGLGLLLLLSFLNLQFLIYFGLWLIAFSLSFAHIADAISDRVLKTCTGFMLLMALLIATYDSYQFHIVAAQLRYSAAQFTLFNSCWGLGCCSALLLIKRQRYPLPPWLYRSARFSYSLYITHFPILLFILGCYPIYQYQQLGLAWMALLLTMLLCIAFAYLSSLLLEPTRHVEQTSG